MREKKVTGEFDAISLREKSSFSGIVFGHSLIITPLTAFLSWFYTDFVGLPIGYVAALFLAARVIDAITESITGAIVDRTKSKYGVCRAWLFRMVVPFGVIMVSNFTIPETSMTGKMIYAAVTYILTLSVIENCIGLPMTTLSSRITRNVDSQKRLSSLISILSVGAVLLTTTLQVPLLHAFGFNKLAFFFVHSIYAVIGMSCILLGTLGVTERVETIALEGAVEKDKQEKRSVFKDFALLFKNKYWVLAVLGFFGTAVVDGSNGNTIYYYTYILGDAGLNGLFSLALLVPLLIGIILMPTISKRIRRRSLFLGVAQLIAAALYVVQLLDPTPIGQNLVITVIRSFCLAPYVSVMFALVAESIEFGEWKTGVRTEGLAFSTAAFIQKLGKAVAQSGGALIMSIGGYNGLQAVQTPQAMQGIVLAITVLAGGASLFTGILMLRFDLDQKLPQITKELKARRQIQSE